MRNGMPLSYAISQNRAKMGAPLQVYNLNHVIYVVKCKVSKGAKIRNRYNPVPHLTQDTDRKVTNSQLDTTNESQEVSPFPAGDHRAHINRGAQRNSKNKRENIKDP